MLSWGNMNMFDYKQRLLADKVSLNLWGVPKGLDDLLYPLGNQGTNPNKVSRRILMKGLPQPLGYAQGFRRPPVSSGQSWHQSQQGKQENFEKVSLNLWGCAGFVLRSAEV
jgi:hypothetical protein